MKSKLAIIMLLLAFPPMVASANPIDAPPRYVVALLFLPAILAEVVVELLILGLQSIWIRTSALLLAMHCVTVPLLWFFMEFVDQKLQLITAIFIGEAATVVVEAMCLFVVLNLSSNFRRSVLRCLGASAVGNLVSFLAGLATAYLTRPS